MKSLTNPKPGDIFYIPAWNSKKEYGFVLARHIGLVEPNIGYLIEVFDTFYLQPPATIQDINLKSRLFRPILWSMYFFKPYPRWKILFSDPNYNQSQSDYENITICFPSGLWIGGEIIKKESTPPNKDYERSICWSVDNIILKVIAHLSQAFKPEESYDYHRAPINLRSDNPETIALIKSLAIEIDQKFKSWQIKSKGSKHEKK